MKTRSSDFTPGTCSTDRSTRTRFACKSYRTNGSNEAISSIFSIFSRSASCST